MSDQHDAEVRLDSTMNMVMKVGVPLIVTAMVGLAATVITMTNEQAAFRVLLESIPKQMDSMAEQFTGRLESIEDRARARDDAIVAQAQLREAKLQIEVADAAAEVSSISARVETLERNDLQQWPRLRALGQGLALIRNELIEVCREQSRAVAGGGDRDCEFELPEPEFR